MKVKKMISILIPAYKSLYLEECINSITSQTYQDWELIILNDASPEDIDGIVRAYNDPRIKYYKNDVNVGAVNVVDNWNKLLSLATGDYVICMGDDDRLCPNCLEEYSRLIEKYPGRGLYHGWTEIINEDSKLTDLQPARPLEESAYSLIWHRWDHRNRQYIGDWCFEAETLRSVGGFHKIDLAWGSDDITAVKAACKNGVVNTQKLVFQYRACSQTISRSSNCKIKLGAILAERKWFEKFLSEPSGIDLDEKYRLLALKKLPIRYKKKTLSTIAEDISCGNVMLRFCKWVLNRKRYHLSILEIIYALIICIKDKKKQTIH